MNELRLKVCKKVYEKSTNGAELTEEQIQFLNDYLDCAYSFVQETKELLTPEGIKSTYNNGPLVIS